MSMHTSEPWDLLRIPPKDPGGANMCVVQARCLASAGVHLGPQHPQVRGHGSSAEGAAGIHCASRQRHGRHVSRNLSFYQGLVTLSWASTTVARMQGAEGSVGFSVE